MRIVSLLPSATEILFELGLGDSVVGVTFECDFPPEARGKRVVSTTALPEGLSSPEIDAVVSERMAAGEDLYRLDAGALADIDPDLIVTQDLCAVCAVATSEVDEALDHLGCRAEVLTLDPMTLGEVTDSVVTVGAATGTEARAQSLVADLRRRLDSVAERLADVADDERPGVLVLEWTDPAFTGGHWVPDMVVAAGGRPVLGHPGARSERVDWDTVAAAEADVVLVTPCGFRLDGSAQQAAAVVAAGRLPDVSHVWALDADAHVVRPGPRVVDGVEIMASVLHPGIFGPPRPDQARLVGIN